jgi:hypothetical protein
VTSTARGSWWRITLALAIAIGPAAPITSVHAQSSGAQAEILFRQGKELMATGQIAEACAAFDASQRLDPTAPTLLNQANCREQNHQLATAWGLFLEAERRTRGAPDKASRQMHATARTRITQIEPRLSTLRIAVAATSQLDGLQLTRDGELLDRATWNRALPIDGGTHRLTAHAPGRVPWSFTVTVAAERDAQTVEVPPLTIDAAPTTSHARMPDARAADLPAAGADNPRAGDSGAARTTHAAPAAADDWRSPASAPVAAAPSAALTTAPDNAPAWTTRRKLAIGAMAGAVVALAGGSVLGVVAKRKQDDAQALCPGRACDDAARANQLIRSGHDLSIAANVSFGVAAVAAITGGILWITGAPTAAPRLAVQPTTSGRVVTASWSF